ncbi:nicotinate (nicotinamide) nucleotide adenylyltransferase [Lyngbya sp. CCAP 1446/10]|uniref:nicotinate (nicotinamide) nucleotide adenylyltransferase n=1 Tax=Lyngbya sp. CCAP 1446/10 TaxID=439293 RepID=UPI002237E66A|nr:nicotinate (nicotinamide) nucleotide adenylyltransferase [Lyngbya sp. CCAP 1446/10]
MWGETHKDLPRLPLCMEKVAILGGTFDPVHCGHLLMAETAVSQFGIDRVIWAIDHTPRHKSHSVLASFDQRREMVALATAGRSDFAFLPVDTNASGTSAIDTLLYLQNLATEAQRYWIIGADALQTLPKWPRCAEIAGLCDWLVAGRESVGVGESEMGKSSIDDWAGDNMQVETSAVCCKVAEQMAVLGVQLRWQVLAMRAIEISSSHIRRCSAESRDFRYLVPESVRSYIATHSLYQQPAVES